MTRKLLYLMLVAVMIFSLAACNVGGAAPTPTTQTAPPAAEATNTAEAPAAEATATPEAPAAAEPTATTGEAEMADAGDIVWLSTQLRPVEEGEKLRSVILKDFKGNVEYIPEDAGPFVDRLLAETKANNVTISLIGGLHGDFPPFIQEDALEDLSALAEKLGDRGFPESFMELGKMGSDKQYYIPWMQATYIMAANKQALEHLPEGADINSLTYDQLAEWGANIQKATGERKVGLPGGPNGLIHRIFQGYLYPAFTGANITKYRSEEAAQMWTYFKDLWQYVNPQSTNYEFMQEPLLSGEVWVALDHTARLINAVRERPDDFVLAPAPSGPKGLAYMPVLAGLAIPKGAPNRQGAEALIDYMTKPETQVLTLREVAFFPVVDVELPGDLSQGVKMEAEAVAKQTNAENALPSLLPVGLGARGGEFNKVFRDTFNRIVLRNEDIKTVLDQEAQNMQKVIDETGAACWAPDPASDGPCKIE